MPGNTPTTTNRNYQKPHPENYLSEDVLRVASALDSIDSDVKALIDASASLADDITATNDDLAALAGTVSNVDNTPDANKPVSTPQQAALDLKLDLSRTGFSEARQSILAGPVDTSGAANHIAIVSASLSGVAIVTDPYSNGYDTPLVLSTAEGYDANGNVEHTNASLTGGPYYFYNIQPYARNFLYVDNALPSTGPSTTGHTHIQPQYVKSLWEIRNEANLLHFDTAGNPVVDEYTPPLANHPWTATGSPSVNTSVKKFGAGSLATSGSNYLKTTNFAQLGQRGAWAIDFWFRRSTAGSAETLFYASDKSSGTGYGVALLLNVANKVEVYLSSGNATWDIASGQVGTGPAITADGTFHHVELSFSGSVYRLFIDGTMVWSQNSTIKVGFTHCAFIAGNPSGLTHFSGYIDEFRLSNQERHSASFTPAVAAYSVDESYDVFRIDEMKMRSYGLGAGAAVKRLYVGEAVTNASAATSVVSYAHRGRYVSPWATFPAANSFTVVNHNVGVYGANAKYRIRYIKNDGNGWNYLEVIEGPIMTTDASDVIVLMPWSSRLQAGFLTGSTHAITIQSRATGAKENPTNTDFEVQFTVERGW